MQITTESVLWIIGTIAIASLVIYSLITWAPSFFTRKDFMISEIHAYYDGKYVHIFATIKNTGNVKITGVRFELTVGGSSGVSVNIGGGSEYSINDLRIYKTGLTIGRKYRIIVTAYFSDGSSKSRIVPVILEEW